MREPLIHKVENDYILAEDASSVWIEVNGISIYIFKCLGDLVVQAYPLGQEGNDRDVKAQFKVHLGE